MTNTGVCLELPSSPLEGSERTEVTRTITPSTSPPPSPSQAVSGLLLTQSTIEDIQSQFSSSVKRKLPSDFVPSENSVICGRGKECFDHEGNKRFRVIIQGLLDKYAEASGKTEKSRIVSKAMNIIREKCSNGGAFVKKEKTGWFEVSARYSREKVGAWFRDCLSHRYKSSSKAKHAKKMAERVSYAPPELSMPEPLGSGVILVDPHAVFNFPENFASQIKAHEKERAAARNISASESTITSFAECANSSIQAFYDIDDLSLIPFDTVVEDS